MEFRRVLFRSGACRGSEDAPAACRGTVILFGGEPSGTGSRGCPAVLDFRREGAGRTSTSAFPARTASLPRAGKSTDPGPRGFREETARRSPPAGDGARQGNVLSQRQGTAKAAAAPGGLGKTGGRQEERRGGKEG